MVKAHVRQVRPSFTAARSFQRTSYLPGELAQTDWWHTGVQIPVGRAQTREAFGLVTGLPFSAGFRVVFTLQRTTAAFLPALLGCLHRLGGLPTGLVLDNDTAIVASRPVARSGWSTRSPPRSGSSGSRRSPCGRRSRRARASSSGWWSTCRPRGCRCGPSPTWATCRARPTAGPGCAPTPGTSGAWAAPSPTRWVSNASRCVRCQRAGPTWTAAWRSGPAATASSGSPTSTTLPSRLAGRRLAARTSLSEVVVFCDDDQVCRHQRSWARADVRLLPAHARELRRAREAKQALAAGDLTVQAAPLGAYDALTDMAG